MSFKRKFLKKPLYLAVAYLTFPHWQVKAEDLSTNPVNEQKNSFSVKITKLNELIREALEKSPMLQMNKHEVESKSAEIGPKGSYDDPMLEFEAMDYPAKKPFKRDPEMSSRKISLSQKIPFPGKLSKMREMAVYETKAKEEIYNNEKLKLIKEIKIHYHDLFLLNKKRNILKEELSLIRQLISISRNQYTLGKIPQVELINFQVEEASLLEQIIMLEKQINIKIGDLNHAAGREEHHQFGNTEEIKNISMDFSEINRKIIQEKVLEQSPSLTSIKNEINASESNLSASKKGYLPDFEFKASYPYSCQLDNVFLDNSGLFLLRVDIPLLKL